MSASWINRLNESDSRLHKEGVLKEALTAALLGNDEANNFLTGLKYCYNSYLTYGIKKIPVIPTVKVTQDGAWADFTALLDSLTRRDLTGHAARDAIAETAQKFSTEEWNTFVSTIIRRDMRAGVSTSTINKIVKGTQFEIPEFKCQLATNSEGRPQMQGIKRLEPKLDGVRVLMLITKDRARTIASSHSRNGKIFENFFHIEEEVKELSSEIVNRNPGLFEDGYILDGEVVGNSFQELMRQARRKEDVASEDSVFHVFDILPLKDFKKGIWNKKLRDRIKILESFKTAVGACTSIELLPHIEVDLDTPEGRKRLEEYAAEMVALGYEGIMIKDLDSPYECDRTTAWLKWKPVYDFDLTVLDIEEGEGDLVGMMGALVFGGVDGGREIKVNVGSGYTDEFRAQVWADFTNKPVTWRKKVKGKWTKITEQPSGTNHIGRMGVVMADACTQNKNGSYSLRFPRFKTFRDDK